MQTPQEYIEFLLKHSTDYVLSSDDKEIVKKFGINEFIFRKLSSKKFRKFAMDPACVERTKHAIELRIDRNESITILYPQGGYKLWRFPSSPEADWAEFFTLSYVLQYASPIAQAYKNGVNVVFYLHTLLMEKHDNLTTEEIQIYVDSFQKLLDRFSEYLPKNISLSILRDADIYSRKEYFECLEEGKKQAEKEFELWPQAKKDDYKRMSLLNIKWKGGEDWTVLSQKEKNKKIRDAALYETAAISNLKKVYERVKSPDNVLVFTKTTKEFIGIGSTKTSLAKYWVGFGVLEKHRDQYQPRILTPKQFELLSTIKHDVVKLSVIPGKNFESLIILDQPLQFSLR